MLLALSLHDFVIVEKLNLDFESGFTVLTGETGAGKSITLDALGLLLGGKADFGQVRAGAKEARISALFDIGALPGLQAQLHEQGLLEEGGTELVIRRTIDAKGKSRSFINNQAATLAQLKEAGAQLIDIHGQNAHHSLSQEAAQRRLLDAFAGALGQAESVKRHYRNWREACNALDEAHRHSEHALIERERLQWQCGELERLGLRSGEWEELNQSHHSLAHASELLQAAEQVSEHIDGDNGMQRQLHRCRKQLESLQNIEPRFAESLDMLASIEAELGEIGANMRDVAGRVEINPGELAEQERRMGELMGMARKYRVEPQDLPAKLEELNLALRSLQEAADIEALEAAVARAEAEYTAAAQQLSAMRLEAAAKLAAETTAHMQKLSMKGAAFHIELQACAPAPHGLEQVQYQVAANQGSPLRPLGKVASGGELARISLSIQVVTSRYTRVPTLVFDEVDTGIGGGTAETVGRALRVLGGRHQVLAVTHLPQVAACGENHWRVRKHSQNGQTTSEINVLDDEGRVDEIARMLGGETITDTTRKHAAELLALSAQ